MTPQPSKVDSKFVLNEYILAASLEDRFLTCGDLSDRLSDQFNISCSKSQIAVVRRAFGLRHLWAKKTEKLSPKHIARRFAFAQKIQRHPFFQLPWIISDESSFVLCPTRSKLYRFRGENSPCIYQEFQGYPIKIMVWGAIGPNGYKSPLIWFKEYVSSQTYVAKLEEYKIFENLDLIYGRGQYVWQQDGARPHTAVSSIAYLTHKTLILPPDISWPPSSPDLSPIEQVWASIKSQINLTTVTDAQSLFNEVNRIWNSIRIDPYIDSLKPRIWALEDLRGYSLAGHNEMIRLYQSHGYEGRDRACRIAQKNCIPIDASKNWLEMTEHTLKELYACALRTDPNLDICSDLEKFRTCAAKFHSLLPGSC
jgi:hypothetical protein